jgi:hypothetical protein
MSAWKEWFGFGSVGKSLLAYTGILLLIGGVCAVIWWDEIKGWLGSKDEESEEDKENE